MSCHTCTTLQDLLESDIKFLVFAHHHSLLDGIEKAINTAKASGCACTLQPRLPGDMDASWTFHA